MGLCALPCPLRSMLDVPDDFRILRRLKLSDGQARSAWIPTIRTPSSDVMTDRG